MRETVATLVKEARSSKLAGNSAWLAIGNSLRLLVQAGYFVLLARLLHVAGYGSFVSVTALAAVFAPFASIGTGSLVVKYTARDRTTFRKNWGAALATTAASGLLLTAVTASLAYALLPRVAGNLWPVLIVLSDLFFVPLADLSGQAYQAHERMSRTAQLGVALSTTRLIAAALLFVSAPSDAISTWAVGYVLSSALVAVAALALVTRDFGSPQFPKGIWIDRLREGWAFAVGVSTQTLHNDVDKTLVARISGPAASGLYSAAYRICDVAFAPIRSVMVAAYPSFFRHGAIDLRSAIAFARRLLTYTGSLSLLTAAVLWLVAPAIPRVLGDGFRDSVPALRILSIIPFLRACHYAIGDALTGAGFQRRRIAVQALVVLANVLGNLALIPRFSWRAAAWLSVACDATLLILLVVTALWSAAAPHSPKSTSIEPAADGVISVGGAAVHQRSSDVAF